MANKNKNVNQVQDVKPIQKPTTEHEKLLFEIYELINIKNPYMDGHWQFWMNHIKTLPREAVIQGMKNTTEYKKLHP